ncbi:O-antigen ligase family protein [Actinopolymorpha alba]|uniref:O-antigen ligase family protein n=1 Tax=Actinopolymorpha alba TaxID=533267 RepID=UPI00192AE49C|nr:O-antigen ligase family protein [Actinopolymorpha alba]
MSPQRAITTASPLLLGGVAATSVFNPAIAVVHGSVICAVILLLHVRHLRIEAPETFAMLYVAFAATSIVWAIQPQWTWYTVRCLLEVLIIFLATRTIITNQRRISVVAWGYVSGCLVAIVLLIYQNPTMPLVVGFSTARYGIDGINVNNLAYALVTGLVVIILLWTTHSSARWARLVLAAAAVAIVFGILQTGCRGALVGVVLVAAWLPIHRFVLRRGISILCIGICLTALVISTGLATSWLRAVDAASVRSTGDLSYRLILWPLARQTFIDHWLLGIGAGGFTTLPPLRLGAHNIVLEVGTGLGIIGLAIFAAVVATTLITGTRGASGRTLILGSLLACWAPMWLSAHWELEPALWLTMAVFSTLRIRRPSMTTANECGDREATPLCPSELPDGRAVVRTTVPHPRTPQKMPDADRCHARSATGKQ